jgi:metal-responsive CopG/Arc/MetJ family transcriptional regulator
MKIQKTFTIDTETMKEFVEISKKTALNKSLFVENAIKEYIKNYKENNDKK